MVKELRRRQAIKRWLYSYPSLFLMLLIAGLLVKGAFGIMIIERENARKAEALEAAAERLALHEAALNQAIAKAQQAIALNPQFPDALEALGIFYSKANRLDEAIETMKRLAQISPNHIMAHTNLSRFYVEKGMILEAEQEQAEARRLSWKAELQAQKTEEGKKKSPEEEVKEREEELKSRI